MSLLAYGQACSQVAGNRIPQLAQELLRPHDSILGRAIRPEFARLVIVQRFEYGDDVELRGIVMGQRQSRTERRER